ncbi:MAG: hypothetical protein HY769_01805 [Candidatus Stahlbacteria bacterium]|nr:hypothetical protein [Candidatus Stahlbacteria bacterium]
MQIAKCEIEPNELNDAKIKIIFLFVFCFLSSVPCYGYSIFSSAGLGEPVYTSDAKERGMGGVFKFDTYKDLAFEFSTLTEAIDTDGKATNFDLTLPQFRFSLPLPKSMAINVGLNEVLNLNFDIQDNWQKCAGDSVQHRITGKGSASTGKVSVCKTLTPVSIEVGGFIVFGSAFEEWITDFGTITDTRDVINMKFNGLGGMGTALLDMGKINLTANYFSSSRLTAKTNLPQRLATSLIFAPTEKFRIGAAITRWQWEKPFTPMQLNQSTKNQLTNIRLKQSNIQRTSDFLILNS